MAFTTGLEHANNTLVFAEHQNVELMGARGNQVISGAGVTAQGTPDLTVAVASGEVLAGGVVVVVASGNIDFSTEHGALTSGQAQFGFVHVDSSGTKSKTMGVAAVAGQQFPADVPEDELVLAQITLTEGDATIDSVDIEDWRINVPKGGYFTGRNQINYPNQTLTGNVNEIASLSKVHVLAHSTDSFAIDKGGAIGFSGLYKSTGEKVLFGAIAGRKETASDDVRGGYLAFLSNTDAGLTEKMRIDKSGNIKNQVDNAGFYTGAGDDMRVYHDGSNSYILLGSDAGNLIIDVNDGSAGIQNRIKGIFDVRDSDDGEIQLFTLNTTARTLVVGGSGDNMATEYFSSSFEIHAPVGTNATILALDKGTTPSATNIQWLFSHRSNDKDLIFFSYDGTTFRQWLEFDFVNGELDLYVLNNLVLTLNSSKEVKNTADNGGYYTGASDELRFHHTGSGGGGFITNGVGNFIIDQNAAAGSIISQLGGSFVVQDSDDSEANMFVLNTTTRALTIGGASDLIDTTFNGDLFIVANGIGNNASVLTFAAGATGLATLAGGLTITGGTTANNIVPDTDSARELGSSSGPLFWSNIFGNNLITDHAPDTGTNVIINASNELAPDSSSVRFKENLIPLEIDSSLIYDLKPYDFNYKESKAKSFSYIAEDVEKILPKLINYDNEDLPISYSYNRLQVLIIEQLKIQNNRLLKLERLNNINGEL